jgi:hypothetical protein
MIEMTTCEYNGCGNEATHTALEVYLSGSRFLDVAGLNVCADHLPYHEEGGPCPEKMVGVWNSRRVHLTKEIGDHQPAFTWREVDVDILRRESEEEP